MLNSFNRVPESNFRDKLFIFAYGPVLQLCNAVVAILDIQTPQKDTFVEDHPKNISNKFSFKLWF